MVRQALRERFVEALGELGGSAGNGRPMAELNWLDDTYRQVQESLLLDNALVKGRGRGGSVALCDGNRRRPAKAAAAKSFEQVFKAVDDVLWKEAGRTTGLDYTEQTSWMLFLNYLDDLDVTRADEAHSWSTWAAPRMIAGAFDHDSARVLDTIRRLL